MKTILGMALLRILPKVLLTTYIASLLLASIGAADSAHFHLDAQFAQAKPKKEDKVEQSDGLQTFDATVTGKGGATFVIRVTYAPVSSSWNLALLTPLDLPAPYGKDSSPLPPTEFLTASKAQLIIGAGFFEDVARTSKRIPMGFVKSRGHVRALPRTVRPGTKMANSHFMDAVVCIDKNGGVISRDTTKWDSLEQWLSETDQFRDCSETGPIFLDKNSETGFSKDAIGIVGTEAYQQDGVRRSLWNYGVVNPVFFCEAANGMAVFGMAHQVSPTTPLMGLGEVGNAIVGRGKNQGGLVCSRAILLGHSTGSYFGGTKRVGDKEPSAQTPMPAVFSMSLKR